MIRAVIFDFFDVIRTDGYNRWLKQHGYEREDAFLAASEKHDRGDYSDKEFFKAIADASGETVEQIEKELEADNVLNEPLVDYISTLRGKYKLALLSNSSSEYLRNELAKYDLEKYFDEIVISSEVGLIKPEPAVFEHIMQKLNVQPQECIFTDDNPKHTDAAVKLGIHGIVYTSVPELKQQIEKIAKTSKS
ncbi:MAG: HAD-superfamily hydrolase, subfamily variant 3 [Candidatus Saccharibacteria bacterium]|nr:HAD-superfamily hydrolase, subfamily variant 3 [Candidatus Saccharibacteria bacterium]